jgi:hypothetical protein
MEDTTGATVGIDDLLAHEYWRHRIDLGDREFTPGTKDASHWHALGLPEDLSGQSVLDVGAFDGLIAFEAERRGAERVLATDIWPEPDDDDRPNSLEMGDTGIELARAYLDSDVERETVSVYDITPETVGTFDVVVFSGVITELKNPFGALERVVSVTEDLVVVEMHNRPVESRETPVPTPEAAVTATATPVYRSQAGEDRVDSLDADRSVRCLYRHSDVTRVEYRDLEAAGAGVNRFYQGWVPEEAVDRTRSGRALRSSVSGDDPSLAAQALAVARREGVRSLAAKGISYLRRQAMGETSGHVVAHGTPR